MLAARVRRRLGANRIAWIEAFLVVVAVRVALWVLPSRLVLGFVADRVERAPEEAPAGAPNVARVTWAVGRAARRVQGARCLTQALAAQLLLARRRIRSDLRIGVRRTAAGEFGAHAWVEVGGDPVIGAGELQEFTRLPDLTRLLNS